MGFFNNVFVRPVQTEAEVQDLHYNFGSLNCLSVQELFALFERAKRNDQFRNYMYVAEHDGQPVGWAAGTNNHERDTKEIVFDYFVFSKVDAWAPGTQRTLSYGQALVRNILGDCGHFGDHSVTLELGYGRQDVVELVDSMEEEIRIDQDEERNFFFYLVEINPS